MLDKEGNKSSTSLDALQITFDDLQNGLDASQIALDDLQITFDDLQNAQQD